MAIQSRWWGPGLRRVGGPPGGGLLIAAFRRLPEVWMVVPREMECEGTISHTTGLWQGAAPGVGLGRAGPVDADEEGQGIWVDEAGTVIAVTNDIVQDLTGPC